jgi:NADH-quinone oxidoreductase subunit C
MLDLQAVVSQVRARFPAAIVAVNEFRNETTLLVEAEHLPAVAAFLRDLEFDMLCDLCAVDHLPRQPRFDLNYQLCSLPHNLRLRLQVRVSAEQPQAPSITSLWPGANWYEREIYDLFGITFHNHPDLRRLLLPDDFLGHPLRRDYIGTYIEENQFTHNFDEIDRQKPYAKT